MRHPTSILSSCGAGLLACAAALSAVGCSRPAPFGADLVVVHGNVWTGDPQRPRAAAVAVVGERIVEVGTDDQIERWRGPSTTVVDAGGRLVVPGFNDAHVRLVEGGARLDGVDLTDADSPGEFARRIVERARSRPGKWIVGGAWNEQPWAGAGLPTRALIDEGTNGTPVFVVRFDGQMALANSAALGRAGITEATPDPPGGTIVRDARGMPTGVLRRSAMAIVARVVPEMSADQRLQAVKRALRHAASLGITSLQDLNASYDDVAVYAELASRRELTARIYAVTNEALWYDQAKLGLRRAFGSTWLRTGAVRGEFDPDGALGDDRRTRLMAADHSGLQVCLDARTERDASTALSLVASLVAADGDRDRRARIEHAELAAASDARRFADTKAIASLDPTAREQFRRLAEIPAVRVAIGSDWPLAPLNPLARLSPAAANSGAAAALTAYTGGSAFAEFQEADKGTISRGKLADMAILGQDLFTLPADRIKNVAVLTTIAGGRVVHQRNP